jgi:hypothetical protein
MIPTPLGTTSECPCKDPNVFGVWLRLSPIFLCFGLGPVSLVRGCRVRRSTRLFSGDKGLTREIMSLFWQFKSRKIASCAPDCAHHILVVKSLLALSSKSFGKAHKCVKSYECPCKQFNRSSFKSYLYKMPK